MGCLRSALWQGGWPALAAATMGFDQLRASIYHCVLAVPVVAVLAGAAFTVPAHFLVAVALPLGLHTGHWCH